MKNTALVSAIMALSLTAASLSFAQGRGYENRNDGNRHGQAQRNDQPDRRDRQARQPKRPHDQRRPQAYERHDERGAGPDHQYYRGERMPEQYRSHQYVVEDWRSHRLSAPPRGYHWVQTGGDYVLVAIATGIILQLLLSN
jgi:Ni/Co efflux regulator RcnB